jgi:hypothetical protein
MTAITGRVEGWEAILNAHVAEAYRATFAWGELDCALWCADWVRKATGEDFGEDWRGRYAGREELEALLAERGYADHAAIADRRLSFIPLSFAGRGDVVLHPDGPLGVCNGICSYFLTAQGVTRLKTSRCVRAWRV